ncbi:MAG: radical SAM protein [Deltaproteobacteria bacterium]|nr:radical SAM protein [Deltaproteobacteria bacterium]
MNSANSKNILLINPGWGGRISRKGRRFNRAWPPLSLLISASLLERAGLHVKILDGRVDHEWRQKSARLIRESDWIGLTSSPLDRWQCPNLEVEYFIELAKSLPPEKLLIMGAHGSLFPGEMLRRTGASAVLRGEPEETLLSLLTQKDWHAIPGLVFRKGSKTYSTGAPSPANLSEFPVPSFHLIDPSRYFYELMGRPFFLFEASRGCPYECNFCLKVMYPKGVRMKPIEHVMAEIEKAISITGPCYGYFIDLEFTTNRAHAMEICRGLISQNYPFYWCCQTRADAVDPDLLKDMKQAGCRLIHFGVESGSQRLLDCTNKRTNLEAIRRGISLARETGIETACFFMLGFPGELPSEMEETLRFAKELNPTYASFHMATPYPGTRIAPTAQQMQDGPDGDMSFSPNCADHDPLFLDKMVHRAYLSYYMRFPYILSRLKHGNLRSLLQQLELFSGFAR